MLEHRPGPTSKFGVPMQIDRTRMYRVKAVADMADVSVFTVYRAIESGGLEALRIGTAVRVPGVGTRRLDREVRRVGSRRARPRHDRERRRPHRGGAAMNPRTAGTDQSTRNVFGHLDEVVERLAGERDELIADEQAGPGGPTRRGVRGRGAGVVAGLRDGAPAADLACGAGRRGRRSGERGAVGAARRTERAGWMPVGAGLPVG